MQEKHLIVKKYLEEHSLVESNIISFNNFIEKRIQEIVSEISETIVNEEFEITLGKIKVGNPNIVESDGSSSQVMPYEARIRSLTYSATIKLEITIKKDGQIDSDDVEIGRIPIMVGSKVCNTHGMSKDELVKNYNDPIDPEGYFIINGNERVMIMSEDLAENQPFIEENSKGNLHLRIFSSRGTYRIPTTISEDKDGILQVSFSRFRDLPAIVLLKTLGMVKESEIAALQGTKKEILDRVKNRIDSYLFPHIGQKKEDRLKKAITLCKLIKQFIIAKEKPELKTDKDHYANKRVRLSGDLLASLFRVNLGVLIRDIQYSLQKSSKRRKLFSIRTIAKSTL